VALLPGVTGAYGRAGGGALLLTAASCELNYNAIRKPSGPAATRMVNHLRMGEALLEMRDPPIRGLFIACNNPAVTNPDAGKTRRGLAREDLFTVVHDPFLSMTGRYADIILPAATYLESEDFYRSYGSTTCSTATARWRRRRGALQRRGGAGAGSAARRHRPVFRMSQPELLPSCSAAPPARRRTSIPHGPRCRPDQYRTKGGQPFRTPSGKLEFYSLAMAQQGLAPMPDWAPDPQEERDAARWPLRLLTAPAISRATRRSRR